MFVDFVLNGQGHGPVGQMMQQVRYEPGMLRPYFHDGERWVTVNTATGPKAIPIAKLMEKGYYSPVFNATMLRKEDWIYVDSKVIPATRQRLQAWADLLASGNVVSGFDAMSAMTYEYEAESDPGEAIKDMEGLADLRDDASLIKLRSAPLPITQSGFFISERRMAMARNRGMQLDISRGEKSARRIGEMTERTLIGTEVGITYGTQATGVTAHDGTSTEYGYITYPNRVTKTDLTTPTGSNPEAIKQDVIEMRETMYTNGFYGPFALYYSTPYDAYLDDDYFRTGSTAIQQTLRERIMGIGSISVMRRLDLLTSGFQMILVNMNSDTVEAVRGMDPITVQWPMKGGMGHNFRVMCIWTAIMKAPYNGVAGIVHGTTS